jgi:hypothetical protein
VAKTKVKGPRQKQRANVYTMMLIIAFLALVLGSLILYLQMNRYAGPDGKWEREPPKDLQAPPGFRPGGPR